MYRSKIYEMMNENSSYYDPILPKQYHLLTNRVEWVEAEINNWIESKVAP